MTDTYPVLGAPAAAREPVRIGGAAAMLLAGLAAVVALAPFAPDAAFGEPFAAGTVALLALGAGVLAWVGGVHFPVSLARLRPPVALFAAFAVWITAQALLPLPAGWAPLWDEAAAILPAGFVVSHLSLDPGATLDALLRLLAAGAAFWVALQLGRSGARARQVATALVGAGVAEAALFLAGLHPVASLAELALVLALALFFDAMERGSPPGRALAPALSNFLQDLASRGAPFAASALILGLASVLGGPAAGLPIVGVLALLATLLAAPSLAVLRRRRLRALWVLLALVAALCALLLPGGVGDPEGAGAALFAAIGDNLWSGTGLGAVAAALPAYRLPDEALGPWGAVTSTLLGAGLPAALVLFALLGWLGGLLASGVWRRRRNAVLPAAALAATIGVTLGPVPAFSGLLAWAVLLGLGAAQSFRSQQG